MIKLNNKNITYVALADSNNSIKAPKEIWYADSPNSVKLVYRRKDALIEGEDYEKYHWLVGDADAYINTLKYYRPYDDSVQMTFRDNLYPNRESKNNKHNVEEQIWGSGVKNSGLVIRSYISGTTPNIKIGNNIFNAAGSSATWGNYITNELINDSEFHNLYISNVTDNKYSFTYNGSQKGDLSTINTLPEIVQGDVLVFVSNEQPGGYFNGSFFNFIHYRNNIEITHLIPCKLLKPVPKWLDANGIRRQVGECGMIDLVSGKFYGNVNSVGTFTVENYYERKEWLRAEINVSGRMALLPVNSMNLYFKSKKIIGSNFHYFGTNDYEYYCEPTNVGRRFSIWKFSENTVVYRNTDIDIDSNEVIIDCSPNKIYVNGYEVPIYEYPISSVDIKAMSNTGMETLTSSIFVNGTERYIPCTLTMDLPASMDANNIARTKGTSGMWDLVSDKFYGNVASSGTFKAVNLAEGVDYEVHQWLCGRNGAYINTLHKLITCEDVFDCHFKWDGETANPNGKTQCVFGCYFYQGTNSWMRAAIAYDLFYVNYFKLVNWDTIPVNGVNNVEIKSLMSSSDSGNYSFTLNGETHEFSNNGLANIETNADVLLFENIANNGTYFHGDIAYFKITDTSSNTKMNLIPVKLLKAIPSKYDANGIARQAGECGMYDTVNDVFYGNVASSGTFSVSDDS